MSQLALSIVGGLSGAPPGELADDTLDDAWDATLRIALADPLSRGPADLSFGIFVSYLLPRTFYSGLTSALNAIVLTVEQPDAGAADAIRLTAPWQGPPTTPNHRGLPFQANPVDAHLGSWHGLRIHATLADESDLYIRAVLHGLASNLVVLPVRALPVAPASPYGASTGLSGDEAVEDQ
jgi:hypothetical protein